jgi:hypothetical protein
VSAGDRQRQLDAQDQAFEAFFGAVRDACSSEPDSAAKLRAAVAVVLEFVAASPEQARLLLLDVVGGDTELSLRVLAYHQRLASFMRAECEAQRKLPALTEQALVGAAASLIGARVVSEREHQLPELEGELVEFLLLPYR